MESFDYTPQCNFCSRELSNVSRMIAGEEAHICNHCVDALYEIVHKPPPQVMDQATQPRGPRLEFYRGKDDRH